MTVAADLATLGWRVDTQARLGQAIRDFQRAWNLGTPLAVDGSAGPATRAALAASVARRKAGRPDASENFSFREFACACGGKWGDCRRIWPLGQTVRGAERLRTALGPFTPLRACRCPRQNAAVAGATKSQHLFGAALDLGTNNGVYDITVARVRSLGIASGIGWYPHAGRQIVRHVDFRHASGSGVAGTVAHPATWNYGSMGNRTAIRPRPDLAVPTPPPPTPTPEKDWFDMATKDDLRAVVREEIATAFADEARWRLVLTRMAFFKDPTTPNRGESRDEPRIPLGRLMEIAGIAALEAQDVPQDLIRASVADAIKDIDVTVRTDTQGD